MVGKRVFSFASNLIHKDGNRSPTPASPSIPQGKQDAFGHQPRTPPSGQNYASEVGQSPQPRQRAQGERISSRPSSMVSSYQPPLMEVTQDTLPELQPIFTYLNSHANKLYQEGYFLKLDDQNTQGKPNVDRTWTECFAQLVGTVLSLWDAAELDAAGQDGEVLPKFINLTDASIKMIEALPTRSTNEQPLQNVLSVSTAGKNRYLLHFNSHHSLIQWTAGIRLAMFEHAILQEAYTGALIAGKGKSVNNIHLILERNKFKIEDWVRVRFGAGTPWRRCWCVITPPDEKEYAKLQKEMNKKKSAYDRSRPPVLKGDVKFYDVRKIGKKTLPIATLKDAYAAFAIYPQSKPLIDASTLIKVEGTIIIHSNPEAVTEGFVFVMPEVHPAVSGFEIMLRWLFPAMDTFALYGRPDRLIADTMNPRSLMFAMPKERRYGYLEILDVANLILTDGSQGWSELQWRFKLKELTAKQMLTRGTASRAGSRYSSSSRRNTLTARNSMGASNRRPDFNDAASVRSQPSISWGRGPPADQFGGVPRTDSAPAGGQLPVHGVPGRTHHRSISESQGLDRYTEPAGQGLDGQYDTAPQPPIQQGFGGPARQQTVDLEYRTADRSNTDMSGFESDRSGTGTPVRAELQDLQQPSRQEPVAMPPKFSHAAGTMPPTKPYHSPEQRRAKSRISTSTLAHMTGGPGFDPMGEMGKIEGEGRQSEDGRRVHTDANANGISANYDREGMVNQRPERPSFERSFPSGADNDSPLRQAQRNSHEMNTAPPSYGQGQGQGHGYSSSQDSANDKRLSGQSISRKPVGLTKPQPVGDSPEPFIDVAAFDKIIPQTQHTNFSNPTSNPNVYNPPINHPPQNTQRPAFDQPLPERPRNPERPRDPERSRAGVMRTVGSDQPPPPPRSNIPDVDFGPTMRYNPQSSQPVQQNQPPNRNMMPPSGPLPPRTSSRNREDVPQPNPSGQAYDPRRRARTPEPPRENRQVPWQPGMAALPPVERRVVTPEQFVQQRAAVPPMYAHSRNQSGNSSPNIPTPPLGMGRGGQTDYGPSRDNFGDRPPPGIRSDSRAAMGSGDMSTNLSAREQEHVARVTGQPLLGIQQGQGSSGRISPGGMRSPGYPPGSAGFMGKIEQSEREKKDYKVDINSAAMREAVLRQQQIGGYVPKDFVAQGDFEMGARGMGQQGVMNQGPNPPPYAGQPPQSQQQWNNQAPAARNGPWSPNPNGPSSQQGHSGSRF